MAAPTPANPGLSPNTYDPLSHTTNIAYRIDNVQTDTSVTPNVTYGDLGVEVDVSVSAPADTFGTATTITAATTFSGVPTISQLAANSFALLANPGGQATFIAEIAVASAFVGTLSFYGLAPDGVTLQLVGAHLRGVGTTANSTAISTAVALNQVWMGSIADFKSVYVVCTAFTSGSVSVQLGLSAAPYAMAILNKASVQAASGDFVAGSIVDLATIAAAITANVMQSNIKNIGGSTYSNTNPFITESNIQNWIRNGQGFIVTSSGLSTATNTNLEVCCMSLFNPAASGKSILIFSIQVMLNASALSSHNTLRLTTTDPSGTTGFTNVITPLNLKPGGAASVASASSSPNGITASITPTGTIISEYGATGNTINELLTNGAIILLPAGAANGIEVNQLVTTAGNAFSATAKAIEF